MRGFGWVFAFAALLCIASSAHAAAALWSMCPTDNNTITHDVNFYSTLTCSVNDAGNDGVIIIGANDITLDCNGMTLIGDSTGKGILADGVTGVTIKNCEILEYAEGIKFLDSGSSLVHDTNVGNCDMEGIWFYNTDSSTIRDCNVFGSGDLGIDYSDGSTDGNIANNLAYGNAANIVVQSEGTVSVSGNTVYGGDTGINAGGSWPDLVLSDYNIFGNYVHSNQVNLSLYSATRMRIYDNNFFWADSNNVQLECGAFDNNIFDNNIYGAAEFAIDLQDYSVVDDVYGDCNNNLFYNNYIDANMHVHDDESDGGNDFNTTKDNNRTSIIDTNSYGGNYWTGYLGADISPLDGFGDTLLPFGDENMSVASKGDYLALMDYNRVTYCPSDNTRITKNTIFAVPEALQPCNVVDVGEDGLLIIDANNVILDCNGLTLVGDADGFGVYLEGKEGVTVKNCDIQSYYKGIRLFGSNSNTLRDNNLSGNYEGIWLVQSTDNNVLSNNASGNDSTGIDIYDNSNANIIRDNNVSGNVDSGIFLNSSSRSIVQGNISDGCGVGINVVYLGTDNNIFSNSISGGTFSGILLDDSVSSSILWDNNILSSDTGIYIGRSANDNNVYDNNIWGSPSYGLYLESDCGQNLFYNNWVSDNGTNVQDLNGFNDYNTSKTLATNIIGGTYKGGNYWGDYSGVDSDLDGIGETAYSFTTGYDYLPLADVERITTCPSDNTRITKNTIFAVPEALQPCNVVDVGEDGLLIIDANNVILDCNGLTLKGDDTGKGIYMRGKTGVTIRNCDISGYWSGIFIKDSNSNTVQDTNTGLAIAAGQAIWIYDSNANTIVDVNGYGSGHGVQFSGTCHSNVVRDSIFYNNDTGILTDNTALTKYNEIYGNAVYGNPAGTGISINSFDENVHDNTIYNSLYGVLLNFNGGGRTTFYGNEVYGHTYGILLSSSDSNIYRNYTHNNSVGLMAFLGASHRIYDNNIFNEDTNCVAFVAGSHDNNFFDNNISGCSGTAISIYDTVAGLGSGDCNNNLFYNNYIDANAYVWDLESDGGNDFNTQKTLATNIVGGAIQGRKLLGRV